MSGNSSISVPDTGPKPVETQTIVKPDGSSVYRQIIDFDMSSELKNIRLVLEDIRKLTSTSPLTRPSGQTVLFDDLGNLRVSNNGSLKSATRYKKLIAAGTTNATMVKKTGGQIVGWFLFNAAAATRFFKLYDMKKLPTVGTDVPDLTIPLPSGAAANVSFDPGIPFIEGLAFATTVNGTDSDSTAVTANDLIINILYT